MNRDLSDVFRKAMGLAAEAEAKGYMVVGPVPGIRLYIGPDASDCKVCGRPGCEPFNRMFHECETSDTEMRR